MKYKGWIPQMNDGENRETFIWYGVRIDLQHRVTHWKRFNKEVNNE